MSTVIRDNLSVPSECNARPMADVLVQTIAPISNVILSSRKVMGADRLPSDDWLRFVMWDRRTFLLRGKFSM